MKINLKNYIILFTCFMAITFSIENSYCNLLLSDEYFQRKANEVFERLVSVACDVSPILKFDKTKDKPWAGFNKNGIIISLSMIKFCYQGVEESHGDDRLAYVIGHEIAHFNNDDLWKEDILDFVDDNSPANKLLNFFPNEKKNSNEKINHDSHLQELKADRDSLLYMVRAGFDPRVIINSERKGFIQELINQTSDDHSSFTQTTHPASEQRAELLVAYMKSVIELLDIYSLGVRLYQLRKYEHAKEYLIQFDRAFPCENVSNNIGLIFYQQALSMLKPEKAYKFKMTTVIDSETKANIFIATRGAKSKLIDAKEYFEDAKEKNPLYIPSYINFSAASIIQGSYFDGLTIFSQYFKKKYNKEITGTRMLIDMAFESIQDAPGLSNNFALALYHSEKERISDVKKIFNKIIEVHPTFSDALYNYGRILTMIGDVKEANKLWIKYLNMTPAGVYAGIIKKELNITTSLSKKNYKSGFIPKPPIHPGEYGLIVPQKLNKWNLKNIDESSCYYYKDQYRVLQIDNFVQFVEFFPKKRMTKSDIVSTYNKPIRTNTTYSGIETLFYHDFAVDIVNNLVTAIIYINQQ